MCRHIVFLKIIQHTRLSAVQLNYVGVVRVLSVQLLPHSLLLMWCLLCATPCKINGELLPGA